MITLKEAWSRQAAARGMVAELTPNRLPRTTWPLEPIAEPEMVNGGWFFPYACDTPEFPRPQGILVRRDDGSAHVLLDMRPGGALEFMTRTATGASTTFLGTGTQPPPSWLKLY